jgi:hypothetical protein
VNNVGDIFGWGLNKNNCLLVNQVENGLVKTIVEEPLEVVLPDYFHKPGRRQHVVQNNQEGFDFYSA